MMPELPELTPTTPEGRRNIKFTALIISGVLAFTSLIAAVYLTAAGHDPALAWNFLALAGGAVVGVMVPNDLS
jgi:hypothetical protein